MSSASPTPADPRRRIADALLDPSEAATLEAHGSTRAAVLVPLLDIDGRIRIVLTRRRGDLRRHGGEISFPGGRTDPDDPSPTATALRETTEEIGIPAGHVDVLGALTPVGTIATGYAVYPVVGWIRRPDRWTVSPREVDEVLELDLAELAAGHGRRRLLRRGIPFLTDVYVAEEHLVWGATARMLGDLLERLPRDLIAPSAPAGSAS